MQANRAATRAQRRKLRRDIPEVEQRYAAESAARRFRNHPAWLSCRTLAAYWPNDGELQTWPLLRDAWEAGRTTFLPRLTPGTSKRMQFRHFEANTDLPCNRYGIAEPAVSAGLIPVWTLDVILLPLVAFDATGNRLGMGGGYYDATLASLRSKKPMRRPTLIGLGHDCQEVAQLQTHSGDVPLDWVITPTRTIRGSGP